MRFVSYMSSGDILPFEMVQLAVSGVKQLNEKPPSAWALERANEGWAPVQIKTCLALP